MKKMIIPFLGLLAISLTFISWKNFKATEAAVHIDDFHCGFRDGNGGIHVMAVGGTVTTSSGNSHKNCKAKKLPNSTGQAVHYNFGNTGLMCITPLGTTDNWQETVSASGNANLTCHY